LTPELLFKVGPGLDKKDASIHLLAKEVLGPPHSLSVRVTGHKTPGESSVNITVSVYDTTHLQENPQRIG